MENIKEMEVIQQRQEAEIGLALILPNKFANTMFSAKYKNKLWKTTFKTTILYQQMNRSGFY
jgi:hypothetical protein